MQLPFINTATAVARLGRSLTAPFRGYGMEKVPGLQQLYVSAYTQLGPRSMHEVTLPDGRLLMDFKDRSIAPSIWLRRTYEPTFSEAIDRLAFPGMCFIDLGAHVGYYAARMARQAGKEGFVAAYEPHPLMARILAVNIYRNGLNPWTEIVEAATADRQYDGMLWTSMSNTGGASLVRNNVHDPQDAVCVPVVTLDNHLRETLDVDRRVDLLKVDVQGVEAAAIDGAGKIIETDRPIILFELNPSQMEASGTNVLAWSRGLEDAGYCFGLVDEAQRTIVFQDAQQAIDWCRREKRDGTGFANIVALHEADRASSTRLGR